MLPLTTVPLTVVVKIAPGSGGAADAGVALPNIAPTSAIAVHRLAERRSFIDVSRDEEGKERLAALPNRCVQQQSAFLLISQGSGRNRMKARTSDQECRLCTGFKSPRLETAGNAPTAH